MKIKLLTVSLVAAYAISTIAAVPNNVSEVGAKKATTNAVKKINKKLFATGGRIETPNSQRGRIVYVNAQKRGLKAWIEGVSAELTDLLNYRIDIIDVTMDGADAPTCVKYMAKNNITIAVFIVDQQDNPISLALYPEQGFSIVNIAPLAKDAKPQFFESRFRKEVNRGLAGVCGGFGSQYKGSLLSGIRSPADLDQLFDDQIPFDAIQHFVPYLSKFGITPRQSTSYRKACQEGWAPAPTNEYQKAVWDKVHQLPKKPMKIEFDPKKGR